MTKRTCSRPDLDWKKAEGKTSTANLNEQAKTATDKKPMQYQTTYKGHSGNNLHHLQARHCPWRRIVPLTYGTKLKEIIVIKIALIAEDVVRYTTQAIYAQHSKIGAKIVDARATMK